MTLSPSEYTGESGTCVVGRVVVTRGPFAPDSSRRDGESSTAATSGKGAKGKGKNKGAKGKDQGREMQKTEVHLLGGTGTDEVLYIEAWADGARQMAEALPKGQVFRVADAKMIAKAPIYSTSRLSYFLRFIPPLGVNTKISICTENPWADLPLHHPFVNFANLKRVQGSLRVSLVGIVSTQPGLVDRETKFGLSQVCNAVLKQGEHYIRCGFWRTHGQTLSQYAVAEKVALHQVNVYYKNGGWEVAASEATMIERCPDEAAAELEANTNLEEAGVALFQASRTDFATVKTTPATLSGLQSVISSHAMRDLGGDYEVHSLAVMGVSSVLPDSSFSMRACKKCKAQVKEEFPTCQKADCADSEGLEDRWIFSLDLADQTGSTTAMLYHDSAHELSFLEAEAPGVKITRAFKSQVWSARLIYKKNEGRNTNYLEIKKIERTITDEGLLSSFRLLPTPQVDSQTGCPFALCSQVSFDGDLGMLTCADKTVSAARLLVRVVETTEDDVVATPDPTNQGFRVCRRAQCCLASEANKNTEYEFKIAGPSGSVQWLMTAAPESTFLVTVTGRGADKAFTVLSHLPVKTKDYQQYEAIMKQHIAHKGDVSVSHASADTPKKRLQTLVDAVPAAATPPPFNKRQKLESA